MGTGKIQTAIVKGPYGGEDRVPVRKVVVRGQPAWAFYAPGWRRMAFNTQEKAIAKVRRHPGFVRMEMA